MVAIVRAGERRRSVQVVALVLILLAAVFAMISIASGSSRVVWLGHSTAAVLDTTASTTPSSD